MIFTNQSCQQFLRTIENFSVDIPIPFLFSFLRREFLRYVFLLNPAKKAQVFKASFLLSLELCLKVLKLYCLILVPHN